MFQLVRASDNVRIEPEQLGKPLPTTIKAALSSSFIDKVVPDLGLVICVYDIEKFEGGQIYPSDGAAHYEVTFRLVVFIPFVGEVIQGCLAKSSKDGLRISCGFFHDIFVPASYGLPEDTTWDQAREVWVWDAGGTLLDFDVGDQVRLRVDSIKFRPVPTKSQMKAEADAGVLVQGSEDAPYAPMQIVGRMADPGLGVVGWWAGEEGSDEEEDEGNGEEDDPQSGNSAMES